MRSYKVFLTCAIVMTFGLIAAQAQSDTWQLTSSNVDLGVSGDFVTVTVFVTGDPATFTVDADDKLLGDVSNFRVDKFGFNTSLDNITPSEISLQNGWSVNTSQQESSFGSFEFEYNGNGNSRMDPLSFSITAPSITSATQLDAADSEGYHSVAHAAGFLSSDMQTSAFLGGNPQVVRAPEPSAVFLMIPGLVGLAVWKKKFRD